MCEVSAVGITTDFSDFHGFICHKVDDCFGGAYYLVVGIAGVMERGRKLPGGQKMLKELSLKESYEYQKWAM